MASQSGEVVDDQIVAVVGGDDHGGIVPVGILLHPVDDDLNGLFARIDGADGAVQIIVVEREIDIAGFDKKSERLALLGGQNLERGTRHVGQGRVLFEVGIGICVRSTTT